MFLSSLHIKFTYAYRHVKFVPTWKTNLIHIMRYFYLQKTIKSQSAVWKKIAQKILSTSNLRSRLSSGGIYELMGADMRQHSTGPTKLVVKRTQKYRTSKRTNLHWSNFEPPNLGSSPKNRTSNFRTSSNFENSSAKHMYVCNV